MINYDHSTIVNIPTCNSRLLACARLDLIFLANLNYIVAYYEIATKLAIFILYQIKIGMNFEF